MSLRHDALMAVIAIGMVQKPLVAQETLGRRPSSDRDGGAGQVQAAPGADSDRADTEPPGTRGRRASRWRGGPGSWTPQERERFYDAMVDRYMGRLTETYALDGDQQTQVRARLEELRQEQRAFYEQHAQEIRTLFERMRTLRENPDAGPADGGADGEEVAARLRALREESPLMNTDRVVGQIEQLLPPEQVQQGRERRQARIDEWEQRREAMRQRWQRRGGPQGASGDPSAADAGEPTMQDESPGEGPDGTGPGGRRRWGDRRRSPEGEATGQADGTEIQVGGDAPGAGAAPPLREDPIGPWERYLRDFTRRYRLDAAQQATAWSVLREVQERRTAHEQSHARDYGEARTLEAGPRRQQRMDELNRPVVLMFEELKRRLATIPSAQQRAAAGDLRAPASSPAASSRPATTVAP